MRQKWLVWIALLAGCGDGQQLSTGEGGGSGGAAGDGGAGGSNACVPLKPTGTCSDPLLAFEPMGVGDFTPLTSRPLAARLDQFSEPMACHTLVIGLYTDDGCVTSSVFTVSVWDQDSSEPSKEVPPAFAVNPTMAQMTPIGANSVEYRFPFLHHYPACRDTFIGVWAQSGICVLGTAPSCDPTKAWQRDNGGWQTISGGTGDTSQLYLGVDDCMPE
jgi:hypothetical protein